MNLTFRATFGLVCAGLAIAIAPIATLSPLNAQEVAEQEASFKRVSDAIEYLASDELQGRGPDTDGLEKSGLYLIKEYESIGLEPLPNGTFRQDFEIPLGRAFDPETAKLTLSKGGTQVEMELNCLLYTSPSPRDRQKSRMPSSA